MNDMEIEEGLKAKLSQGEWGTNLAALLPRYHGWTPADAGTCSEDDLMCLWGKESGKFASTGLPPLSRPTEPARWQSLRGMTAILVDGNQPIGERLVSALDLGRATFTTHELSFPSLMRAAMILANGRYGTIVTRSSGNELLAALGEPPLQFSDAKSLTAGWERFERLIDEWAGRVGAADEAQRAQIPWHYLELLRSHNVPAEVQDSPTATEVAAADSDPRRVIEALLPNSAVRALVVDLFAESIERANAIHPSSWALAVIGEGSGLSLTVSTFLAVRVRSRTTLVTILEGGTADDGARDLLKPFHDVWKFASIPDATLLDIPNAELAKIVPAIREAHLRFVARAAERVRLRTPYRRNHSPAMIAYLSSIVGRTLPQPQYVAEPSVAATRPTELDALTRQLSSLLEQTRNVILHGPPGTGKTFAVRSFRAALLAEQPPEGGARRDEFCTFVTFHQSFSYEDFVEGIRPRTDGEGRVRYDVVDGVFKAICRRADANPERDYLLVIDEINRANIAKVFGELITLLEDDKRVVAGEPGTGLTVTLPYSQDTFGVPSNLYVLGTMNTADRSIALLDLALRRRFAFVEVPPRPELLSDLVVGGVGLEALLTGLNHRVAFALDRDHLIGHSYLMEVADVGGLRFAWERKIVPLLAEYFYNDAERLRQVIGAKFFAAVRPPKGWDGDGLERWEYVPISDDAAFLAAVAELAAGGSPPAA